MEIVHIEALKMDNGEILLNGKTIGLGKDVKIITRFDISGNEIKE